MYGLCTSWREKREGRFFSDILLAGLNVLVYSISAEMQEAAELVARFCVQSVFIDHQPKVEECRN